MHQDVNADSQQLTQLKMAWIAAKEVGDTQAQMALLRAYPDAQDALIDFIAAYSATNIPDAGASSQALLPLTQRACQSAVERVFGQQPAPVAATLQQLRAGRGLSLVAVAQGLHLGVDVWKKFESGAIDLASLTQRQLERFAHFFQIGADQFGSMLNNSQPTLALNRRQTDTAARSQQQAPAKQNFAEAIKKSTMPPADKRFWLDA